MELKKRLQKFLNNQNWNIGFAATSSEELVQQKRLGKVEWLKHSYKDRFFADPFVYSWNDEQIVVFVEELEFDKPVGRLTELIVDAKTKKLLGKHTLLQLNSHLSYPAIICNNGEVFVYPENGANGKLTLYKYERGEHKLKEVGVVVEEGLTDATIHKIGEDYYMFATKVPNTQEDLYLYKSKRFDGDYKEIGLVSQGRENSRSAGNLFEAEGNLYRPAQNCSKRYGGAVEIMKCKISSVGKYSEEHSFSLNPTSFKYNIGLHTINFHKGGCVIDGYGFLYPIIGRLLHFLRRVVKGPIKRS